jgi:hypothetical protein
MPQSETGSACFWISSSGILSDFVIRHSSFSIVAHEFRQPTLSMVAPGSATGAFRFLLVVPAQAPTIVGPVHQRSLAARTHRGHFAPETAISLRLFGDSGGLPHPGDGPTTMGIRLGGRQSSRAGYCRGD